MTAQEHLKNRLRSAWKYELTEEDQKALQIEGIEKYIFRKLKSKKFRKTKMDDDSIERVKEAIAINVSRSEPIKFTFPFGGYKIWRVPSFPEVDWAEFMTIAHVLEYIAPILQAYKPGVDIAFSSDDVIIELLDNYPRADLDSYVSSFEKLIAAFQVHFPTNLNLQLERVANLYSDQEYQQELEQNYDDFRKEGLTEERIQKDFKYSEFNFKLDGKVDHTKTDKQELDELKLDLMYWSQAYLKLSKRRAFVRGDDKVVLFCTPISNAIDIGSTKVSMTKFWTGVGVLEHMDGKYYERILSPKQFDSVSGQGQVVEVESSISMENFGRIIQFNQRLNFKN